VKYPGDKFGCGEHLAFDDFSQLMLRKTYSSAGKRIVREVYLCLHELLESGAD
jgi:hypothetical protein